MRNAVLASRLHSLVQFYVFSIFFGDLGLLLVAVVQIKAVTKCRAFACGNVEVARSFVWQLFEVMLAKRISREQSIVAHVPPGRMPGVLRVIEYGDADSFSIYGTVIVAPIRAFAPGGFIPIPAAID